MNLKLYLPRSPSLPTFQAPGYAVSSSFASRSSVRLRNVHTGAVKISYLEKLISELSGGRGSFVRARARARARASRRDRFSSPRQNFLATEFPVTPAPESGTVNGPICSCESNELEVGATTGCGLVFESRQPLWEVNGHGAVAVARHMASATIQATEPGDMENFWSPGTLCDTVEVTGAHDGKRRESASSPGRACFFFNHFRLSQTAHAHAGSIGNGSQGQRTSDLNSTYPNT